MFMTTAFSSILRKQMAPATRSNKQARIQKHILIVDPNKLVKYLLYKPRLVYIFVSYRVGGTSEVTSISKLEAGVRPLSVKFFSRTLEQYNFYPNVAFDFLPSDINNVEIQVFSESLRSIFA